MDWTSSWCPGGGIHHEAAWPPRVPVYNVPASRAVALVAVSSAAAQWPLEDRRRELWETGTGSLMAQSSVTGKYSLLITIHGYVDNITSIHYPGGTKTVL